MNASLKFLTTIAFITLAACSTQEVKQDATSTDKTAPAKPPAISNKAAPMSGQNPPMTIMKGDKKLSLVRIMDGGICKNELQGVKGAFLLYADQNDINRIKREKGSAIFTTFETKIQDIAADVLQETIEKMNLSEDPFALGADEAQEKLTAKLTADFRNAAATATDKFQKETTLTIDIAAFPSSFVFFQKGCEITSSDSEKTEPDSPPNTKH